MEVIRRYTFKLYPTKAQETALNEQARFCAQLWNAALEQREIQWAHECQRKPNGERKGLGRFDQGRELKFVRADNPAIAAMSQASLELMLESLDLAFKAFFRRAKGGAGISSGYPRYKRTDNATTVPHRDHPKGWRMQPNGKHWQIYAKGIPGLIKARGKFPADPSQIRTMELIRRDGAWWSSIVVKMEARLVAGRLPVEINFDLIDEFASVKNRSNGECLSGLTSVFKTAEGRKLSVNQGGLLGLADGTVETEGDDRESGELTADDFADGTVETEGDDRTTVGAPSKAGADGTVETEGDDRTATKPSGRSTSDGTIETEGDDRVSSARMPTTSADGTIEIQSMRDRRFKKFSNRWRREKARIAKMKARQARQRREALHLWTTRIIREAADVLVTAPPIKASTKSGRGDDRDHGAAVATVALLNRHVLSQAPAAAIQMLEYKAAEAGIQFTRITPDEHAIQIGRDIHVATKAVRKVRRSLIKETQI